jgi:hypothetical protein
MNDLILVLRKRERCKWALEEKGTDFVFVIDWKTQKRPFYAYPNEQNSQLSNPLITLRWNRNYFWWSKKTHI